MGENAPENAKMMVYKKRLIDHHTCVTTTKYVRTVLCYKNSPDFFVFRYTYPLVLTGVDSNRYLPGCQRHACNEAYVLSATLLFTWARYSSLNNE